MISERAKQEISRIVGPPHFTIREDDLLKYGTDATKLHFMPDGVAFPGTEEEVSSILRLANRDRFPVIPRGAGSGKSGGALPVEGGLVMSMERFNRILSVDADNFILKVEPGVITAHIQEEVEKRGLFYPPDPASVKVSTIGGNVAHCAGGLRAVKYGVTREYVLGLSIVLPTGEIIKTGVQTAKGVVGYDLTRLIVGSEGTLGVITSITLRLIRRPESSGTMVSFFRDLSSSVRTVSAILRAGIVPSALEFMDRLCMQSVHDQFGFQVPQEASAMLLIQVDGEEVHIENQSREIRKRCLDAGALLFKTASNRDESEKLWEARRNVSPSLYNLKPDKVSEDVVVPRSKMVDLVLFLEDLSRKYGLLFPSYGHAGDGNVHVNILFDRKILEEASAVELAVRDLFGKVLEMGGTLSGEHGVGMTKRPYVGMELSSPALELMARIKAAFDPNGILNPGKIIPHPILSSSIFPES